MGKYFVCKCSRCEDPTELGTHLSSVNCTGCDDGLCSYYAKEWVFCRFCCITFSRLIGYYFRDKWMCNKCHESLGGDYVKQVLVAARKEAMVCCEYSVFIYVLNLELSILICFN